ncbi:hypothetical protein SAMN04487857_102374 [Pseudomonas sp. ok272]|uniref:hypothetical protein n=1 Tax=unclassified Pseudomonas TaxID=196821 RepID=UPI0008D77BA5|nr:MULTISPECIES: hypothetical protein [unclassified Pseudomonas]SEM51201.1 hypothetical protein SAMN04487857_102374 [Pseudomonas sp. ok272]SFM22893.1 hypothetical protein SAMN04487858_101375 [Pseudomonas sp. ok602]
MKAWDRYKEERKHRKDIEGQIKRIEQLSKVVPEQTLDMEQWGFVPEEVKTLEQAEQWLAVLQTAQLRRKAERYGIEMPDTSIEEFGRRMEWDADQDEPYYLTSKGMRIVNLALREEDKYRWDKWNTRISVTIAPLSLIVAILALVVGK